jgi:hypothetical protein
LEEEESAVVSLGEEEELEEKRMRSSGGTYELVLQVFVEVILGPEPLIDGLHRLLVLLWADVFLKGFFHCSYL